MTPKRKSDAVDGPTEHERPQKRQRTPFYAAEDDDVFFDDDVVVESVSEDARTASVNRLIERYSHYHDEIPYDDNNHEPISFKIREILDVPQLGGVILSGKTINNKGIHAMVKMESYVYIERKKPFKNERSVEKFLVFLERFIAGLDTTKIQCRNPYMIDESYRYRMDGEGRSIYDGSQVDPTVVSKTARVSSQFIFNPNVNTKTVYGYDDSSYMHPKWKDVLKNPFIVEDYADPNDDLTLKKRRKAVLLSHKKTSSHYCVEPLRIAKVRIRLPFFAEKFKFLFESKEYYDYVTQYVLNKFHSKGKKSLFHYEDYLVRTYESDYQFYTNMATRSVLVGKWHKINKYRVLDEHSRFSYKHYNILVDVRDIACEPDKEFLVSNRIASYDIETAAGSTKYSTDAKRFPVAYQGKLPSTVFHNGRPPQIYTERVDKMLEKYQKEGIDILSDEFKRNTDPVVVFGVLIRDEGLHRGYDYGEGRIFIYKRKLAKPAKTIKKWKSKLTERFRKHLCTFSDHYDREESFGKSDVAKNEFETLKKTFATEDGSYDAESRLKWFYDKIEIVECDSEMEMIYNGIKYMHLSDSDILTGWNLDFDDMYCISRWAYHKYTKNVSVPEFNMTCFVNGASRIKMKDNRLYVNHDGYVVNDGYQIFQKNKEDMPSYKLGFVAHELLKYPKHITNYAIVMAFGNLTEFEKSEDPKVEPGDGTVKSFFDNYRFISNMSTEHMNHYSKRYLKMLWDAANDPKFAANYVDLWKTDENDASKTFEMCMKKIEWEHSAAANVSKCGGSDMTLYGIYNAMDTIIPICILSKKGIYVAQESFSAVTGCNYSAVYTEGQMYKVVGALRIRCKTYGNNNKTVTESLQSEGDLGDDSSVYLFPDTGNLHYHYAGVFRGDKKCDDMVRERYNEYTLLYKLRKYRNAKLALDSDLVGEQDIEYELDAISPFACNFNSEADAFRDDALRKATPNPKAKTNSNVIKTNVPIISDTIDDTDYSNVLLYGPGILDATSNQGGKVLVPFQQGFHKAKVITDDASSMYPANMVADGLTKEQMTNTAYAKKHKIPKYAIHTTTIGAHHLNIAGEVVLSEKEAIYCGSESAAVKQTHFMTTETGVVYDTIMANFDERNSGKENKTLWGFVANKAIPKTVEEIQRLCKNPLRIMDALLENGSRHLLKYDITLEKMIKLGLMCDKNNDLEDPLCVLDAFFEHQFDSDAQKWKDAFVSKISEFKDKRKIFSIINVLDRFSEFNDRLEALQATELWADNYDKYQLAVKCLMNSLYGIFMMLYGPLSEPAISATVTGFGRFLISCVQCSVERQTATFTKRANGTYDADPAGLNPTFAKSKDRASKMPKKPFPIEENEIRTIKGIGKLFRVIDDGMVDLVVSLFKTTEALFALYGDTDSVMIKLPYHSIVNGDQAYDAMERITDMINAYMFSKIGFQPEKYSEGMVVTSRQKTYDMMAFMERKKIPNWLFKGADKSDIMPFLREFIGDCKKFLFVKTAEGFGTGDILSIIFLKAQKMLLKFATNQLPISSIAVSKKLNKYTKGGSAQHNVVADKKIERGESVNVGDIIVFMPILEIVETQKKARTGGITVEKTLVHSVEDADYVLSNINAVTIDYENIFEKKIKNCLFAFLSSVFAKITDLPYADSPFTAIRTFKMKIVTTYMEQIERYLESILLYGEHGILTRFHMRRQMLMEKMSKLLKKPPPLRECACCFKFYRDETGDFDAISRSLPEKIAKKLVTLCTTCKQNASYHSSRFYKKLEKITKRYRVQRTICTICIEAPLTPRPKTFKITPESCDFTLCSVHKEKSYLAQQIARLENIIFSLDIYNSTYLSDPDAHTTICYEEDVRTGLEDMAVELSEKMTELNGNIKFVSTFEKSLDW